MRGASTRVFEILVSDGYSCSYLNWLHDNENIAYDCDTQADTLKFTASDMCCTCGGGESWTLGGLLNDIQNRCEDLSSERVDFVCYNLKEQWFCIIDI